MSTVFFKKKRCLWAIYAFCGMLACFFCVFIYTLATVKTVDINANFYFLAVTDPHVEVGAEFAKSQGGAGYVLRQDNVDYAILSVYLNESEAVAIQNNLQENTLLIKKSKPKLYFKGAEKKRSHIYEGALKTFYGKLVVLNEYITRLEKGMTQENCKRSLERLEKMYGYEAEQYKNTYSEYAEVCRISAEGLSNMRQGIIYAKDLRYFQCEQVEKYITLCERFAL